MNLSPILSTHFIPIGTVLIFWSIIIIFQNLAYLGCDADMETIFRILWNYLVPNLLNWKIFICRLSFILIGVYFTLCTDTFVLEQLYWNSFKFAFTKITQDIFPSFFINCCICEKFLVTFLVAYIASSFVSISSI